MGFIAVCSALYDYEPQGEGELEIKEGELLFILEKGDDDWWKAKKKADGEEEDEPEGLIPNNYVEDAKPKQTAKALYDYTRQTDEELSFTDDTTLEVYDTSDPDWTLVGFNGEYGFAPANYIELNEGGVQRAPSAASTLRASASPAAYKPSASPTSPSPNAPRDGPAASLAKVLGGGAPASPTASRAISGTQQFTPEASDEEENAPQLPRRPPSGSVSSPQTQYATMPEEEALGVLPSPPYNRATSQNMDYDSPMRSPGGFRLYHINEMVSAMGKRRKMPTTLGLNLATGTIMFSPDKARDGPSQEWTAEKMSHYSIEGKHVFIELVRPSKSLDLHAGTSDTAKEIVGILGEIGGAVRGEGINEVLAAATGVRGQKTGVVLYEFMAQGDDEVTVAVGDEVIILDDTRSEEWWQVRRIKKGTEGVVPSSYIEITGVQPMEPPSRSGANAGRSNVEQNRLEEERLAKEAAKRTRARSDSNSKRDNEVGPGMKLPQRGSSLAEDDQRRSSKRDKRASKSEKGSASRSKPDPHKTRTWTDHSGSFKVEAQFIGVADGKIHLHKVNGVKIAVPISKMSPPDLAYVEAATNLEDDMPLSAIRDRMNSSRGVSGASIERPKAPEYDWFDFFLKAGVGPHQCERYSQTMVRDSMDESVLPDITAETLRTLGLKEGDILKVMKFLDQKLGRSKPAAVPNGKASGGGLFSGPGGALHDNTRRGRPEANRQASDVVDADAFQPKDSSSPASRSDMKATSLARAPEQEIDQERKGFDDNAWDIKPSTQSSSTQQQAARPALPVGAIAELSILDTPLQPTVASPPPRPAPTQVPQPTVQPQQTSPQTPAQQRPQQPGANPSFFTQLNTQQAGLPNGYQGMPDGSAPRQRPQPPPQSYSSAALLAPPPRPMSAPQNFQQGQFGPAPLQPQLTGVSRNAALQAPQGQSLGELNQQRFQQQQYGQYQNQMQPQQTGYLQPQQTGFQLYQNGMMPQQTGFQQQFSGQPYLNGNASGSPFADQYRAPPMPPQPGFLQPGPGPGSLNSVLPPSLVPQKTAFQQQPPPQQQMVPQQTNGYQQPQQMGFQQQQPMPMPMQPQMTGFQQPQQTNFGQPPQQQQQNGYANFQPPPVPPMPQQHQAPAPLVAQKTGPAPPVRFGVAPAAKKLTPQPTGRANLANATPQNPFGF